MKQRSIRSQMVPIVLSVNAGHQSRTSEGAEVKDGHCACRQSLTRDRVLSCVGLHRVVRRLWDFLLEDAASCMVLGVGG